MHEACNVNKKGSLSCPARLLIAACGLPYSSLDFCMSSVSLLCCQSVRVSDWLGYTWHPRGHSFASAPQHPEARSRGTVPAARVLPSRYGLGSRRRGLSVAHLIVRALRSRCGAGTCCKGRYVTDTDVSNPIARRRIFIHYTSCFIGCDKAVRQRLRLEPRGESR